MSHAFGLMIESLVAILLVMTISYCFMLNQRLKRFKADEQSLKATISELITATEIAERAIAGLKHTVHDCDQNIGESLRAAEKFSADIAAQIEAGEGVLRRLSQIASVARPLAAAAAPVPAAPSPPDARDLVAAANAIAERTRSRVSGLAA
jgi:ABC-type transporter Mla subunit MlaD